MSIYVPLHVRSSSSSDLGEDRREGSILLIESSRDGGRALVEQLCADSLPAILAHTLEHARAIANAHQLRAVVLGQLERPRGALDLLEEIRHGGLESQSRSAWEERLPAIVLGSGDAQLELLRAFEAGADDYIQRPVSYLELRARLKALLRRAETVPGARVLRVGSLEIDTRAHVVRLGSIPIELRRLEYELLVHLASDPTAVHSKQELLCAIWKRRSSAGARTVDSHASRLRRKLDAAGATGFVVNVWGVGYRLI